jgi:hypothetical protein
MATAQTSQSKASKARQPASRTSSRQSDTEELSGERDENYNLISVLYHGLQGADQCAVYADDADDAGDEELAEFLRSAGEQQGQIAKQAKQLLSQRLGGTPGRARAGREAKASDDEDEDED